MLFLVLLAAVVAPRVTPQRITGVASTVPIPPAPAVGDCLLQPVPSTAQLVHPPAVTGPCNGSRYGEVVLLIPATAVLPTQESVDGPVDPNRDVCATAVIDYLGLGPTPGHPGDPTVFGHPRTLFDHWSPVLPSSDLFISGPDEFQLQMGQNWLACISFAPAAERGTGIAYHRSAAGSFSGTPPAAYAVCLLTADTTVLQIADCRQPHQAEIFGYLFTTEANSPPALATTCRSLITQLTGMADPTAAGRLLPGTFRSDGSVDRGSAPVDPTGRPLSCLTTAPAGHQLTGPLMDLGNKPVPLD